MLQFIKVSNNQVVNVSQIISAKYSAETEPELVMTISYGSADGSTPQSVELVIQGANAERVWQRLSDISTN